MVHVPDEPGASGLSRRAFLATTGGTLAGAVACVVLSTRKNKGNRMDNQKPLNNEDIKKVAGGGGGIDRGGPLPAQLIPKITSQGTKDATDVTLDPPALGLPPTNQTT